MVFLIIVEHEVLIIFCNIFLDITGNITYDWSNIIHKIEIWSSKGEWHIIDKMVWKLLPEFPACASIHLINYFDKSSFIIYSAMDSAKKGAYYALPTLKSKE